LRPLQRAERLSTLASRFLHRKRELIENGCVILPSQY
jgi:hypothetical protein